MGRHWLPWSVLKGVGDSAGNGPGPGPGAGKCPWPALINIRIMTSHHPHTRRHNLEAHALSGQGFAGVSPQPTLRHTLTDKRKRKEIPKDLVRRAEMTKSRARLPGAPEPRRGGRPPAEESESR